MSELGWLEFDGKRYRVTATTLTLTRRVEGNDPPFYLLYLDAHTEENKFLRLDQIVLEHMTGVQNFVKARMHVSPEEVFDDDNLGSEPTAEWDTSGWLFGDDGQRRVWEITADFARIEGDLHRVRFTADFFDLDDESSRRARGTGEFQARLEALEDEW